MLSSSRTVFSFTCSSFRLSEASESSYIHGVVRSDRSLPFIFHTPPFSLQATPQHLLFPPRTISQCFLLFPGTTPRCLPFPPRAMPHPTPSPVLLLTTMANSPSQDHIPSVWFSLLGPYLYACSSGLVPYPSGYFSFLEFYNNAYLR